ncbi:MAG: hypothetical protein ACON5A_03285 [Candidatus Comchoanobacterales bacterium]
MALKQNKQTSTQSRKPKVVQSTRKKIAQKSAKTTKSRKYQKHLEKLEIDINAYNLLPEKLKNSPQFRLRAFQEKPQVLAIMSLKNQAMIVSKDFNAVIYASEQLLLHPEFLRALLASDDGFSMLERLVAKRLDLVIKMINRQPRLFFKLHIKEYNNCVQLITEKCCDQINFLNDPNGFSPFIPQLRVMFDQNEQWAKIMIDKAPNLVFQLVHKDIFAINSVIQMKPLFINKVTSTIVDDNVKKLWACLVCRIYPHMIASFDQWNTSQSFITHVIKPKDDYQDGSVLKLFDEKPEVVSYVKIDDTQSILNYISINPKVINHLENHKNWWKTDEFKSFLIENQDRDDIIEEMIEFAIRSPQEKAITNLLISCLGLEKWHQSQQHFWFFTGSNEASSTQEENQGWDEAMDAIWPDNLLGGRYSQS